jgi:hypothetical protein
MLPRSVPFVAFHSAALTIKLISTFELRYSLLEAHRGLTCVGWLGFPSERGKRMCAVRLLLARPVEGSVGERERVTHLVHFPQVRDRFALARACCGREFGPGELELLEGVTGMPCEECLRKAPVAARERKPAGSEAIVAQLSALEAAVGVLAERVDEIRKLLEVGGGSSLVRSFR